MSSRSHLAQLIRRRREKLGLNRKELALKAGTSDTTVASLELGFQLQQLRRLAGLARALNITPITLVEAAWLDVNKEHLRARGCKRFEPQE